MIPLPVELRDNLRRFMRATRLIESYDKGKKIRGDKNSYCWKTKCWEVYAFKFVVEGRER